jgi:hypothetical protein
MESLISEVKNLPSKTGMTVSIGGDLVIGIRCTKWKRTYEVSLYRMEKIGLSVLQQVDGVDVSKLADVIKQITA